MTLWLQEARDKASDSNVARAAPQHVAHQHLPERKANTHPTACTQSRPCCTRVLAFKSSVQPLAPPCNPFLPRASPTTLCNPHLPHASPALREAVTCPVQPLSPPRARRTARAPRRTRRSSPPPPAPGTGDSPRAGPRGPAPLAPPRSAAAGALGLRVGREGARGKEWAWKWSWS